MWGQPRPALRRYAGRMTRRLVLHGHQHRRLHRGREQLPGLALRPARTARTTASGTASSRGSARWSWARRPTSGSRRHAGARGDPGAGGALRRPAVLGLHPSRPPPLPGVDLALRGRRRAAGVRRDDGGGGRPDIWIVGGGDLVGQFDDAGLLDEIAWACARSCSAPAPRRRRGRVTSSRLSACARRAQADQSIRTAPPPSRRGDRGTRPHRRACGPRPQAPRTRHPGGPDRSATCGSAGSCPIRVRLTTPLRPISSGGPCNVARLSSDNGTPIRGSRVVQNRSG